MEISYPNKSTSESLPERQLSADQQVSGEKIDLPKAADESSGGDRVIPKGNSLMTRLLLQAFFLSLLTPNVATSCWEGCENFFLILPLYAHLLLIPFSWPLFATKVALFYIGLSKIRNRNFPKKKSNLAILLLAVGISALVVVYYWSFTEEGRANLINLAASQARTKSGVLRVLDFFGDAQKAGSSTGNGYYQKDFHLQVGFYCLNDCVINWPGGSVFCFSNEKVIYSAESQSVNYSSSVAQELSILPKCNGNFSVSCNAEDEIKRGAPSCASSWRPKNPSDSQDPASATFPVVDRGSAEDVATVSGVTQKKSEADPTVNNTPASTTEQGGADIAIPGSVSQQNFEADLASVWWLPVKVSGQITRVIKLIPAPGSDHVNLRSCNEKECLPEHSVYVAEGDSVIAIDVEFTNRNTSTGDVIRDHAYIPGLFHFQAGGEYRSAKELYYYDGQWGEQAAAFYVVLDKPVRMTLWVRMPSEAREVRFFHPGWSRVFSDLQKSYKAVYDFEHPVVDIGMKFEK